MIRYLTRCNIISSLLSVSLYVDSYMGVHRLQIEGQERSTFRAVFEAPYGYSPGFGNQDHLRSASGTYQTNETKDWDFPPGNMSVGRE